jgi:hypothetical protein
VTRPDAARLRAPATWAPLAVAALVAVSAAVRWLGARGVPSPWYTPDEQTYGLLGRSLWHTGHLDLLGHSAPFYTLVYAALAGAPLSVGRATTGYAALKVVQAIAMSLAAVPVYLWARSLVRRGWAVVAAALTLTLPALAFTGFVMTEVAFYPILPLAAWAVARALARPTVASQSLAVAAVVVAALTRIQAIVLAPAVVFAIVLFLLFERSALGIRRYAVLLGGLAVAVAVWLVLQSGHPLGAYEVTGRTSYGIADAVRFSLYHAADLVLMTAVIPVAASALIAVPSLVGRERSADVRAYVAVTLALSAGIVAQVGLFTSRLLGRLAERNLIGLAPLVFVGFAVWLDRRCPRPRIATAVVASLCLALLAYLPVGRFASQAAEPDAYSMIPLYQLSVHHPGENLRLDVVIGAAGLLVLLALWPRDARWLLPLPVAALLCAASVSATSVVATQARLFRLSMIGTDRTWVDDSVHAPVTYLYNGEASWSAGAPPWVNVFWNTRITRVLNLGGARIAGSLPYENVHPDANGTLVDDNGAPVRADYVVAGAARKLAGTPVAASTAGLVLWRTDGSVRLAQ